MMPWPVAVFVGLFLLAFSISMMAFAIAIEALLICRLAMTLKHWDRFLGSVLTAAIMGPFAYMFGMGAYQLASKVIDGFIVRFL